MTVSIDIVDQDVFTALRSFLLLILPNGTEIVQGLDNLVSMPTSGFVCMTSMSQNRLATNTHVHNSTAQTTAILAQTEYKMQLDFYGSISQQWAELTQTLFRDSYAIENMPSNIVPLYADNPIQIPLVNGEAQWEQRWRITTVMQYNPTVTIDQQSALTINVGLKEVDTTFNP